MERVELKEGNGKRGGGGKKGRAVWGSGGSISGHLPVRANRWKAKISCTWEIKPIKYDP